MENYMVKVELDVLERNLVNARNAEEEAALEYQKKQEETIEAALAIEKFKVENSKGK